MCIDKDIQKIKEELSKNKVHILSFDDVDFFLLKMPHHRLLIEFDNSVVKNYFVNNIRDRIINCNSSYNRFYGEMESYFSQDTIFNNLELCNDLDILTLIRNTNNIMIL